MKTPFPIQDMGTQFTIQVSSPAKPDKLELNMMFQEEWNADAETRLVQKIREVLSIARAGARSFSIQMEMEVDDPNEVIFLIKKRLGQVTEPEVQKLSLRELEVLGFIMIGYTNQEIADKLYISYETVRSHRKNILTKTGTHNTASLINYYNHTFFEK